MANLSQGLSLAPKIHQAPSPDDTDALVAPPPRGKKIYAIAIASCLGVVLYFASHTIATSSYAHIRSDELLEQTQYALDRLTFSVILLDSLTAWTLPLSNVQFRLLCFFNRYIPLVLAVTVVFYGALCLSNAESNRAEQCTYQIGLAVLSMQCLDDFAERMRTPKSSKINKSQNVNVKDLQPEEVPPSPCQFALCLSVHVLMVLGWLLDKEAIFYFMGSFFLGRATVLTDLSAASCFVAMLLTYRSQWPLLLLIAKVITAVIYRSVSTFKMALALVLVLYSIFTCSWSLSLALPDLSPFADVLYGPTVVWIAVMMTVSVSAWHIGLCCQWTQNLVLDDLSKRRRGTVVAKVGEEALQLKSRAKNKQL